MFKAVCKVSYSIWLLYLTWGTVYSIHHLADHALQVSKARMAALQQDNACGGWCPVDVSCRRSQWYGVETYCYLASIDQVAWTQEHVVGNIHPFQQETARYYAEVLVNVGENMVGAITATCQFPITMLHVLFPIVRNGGAQEPAECTMMIVSGVCFLLQVWVYQLICKQQVAADLEDSAQTEDREEGERPTLNRVQAHSAQKNAAPTPTPAAPTATPPSAWVPAAHPALRKAGQRVIMQLNASHTWTERTFGPLYTIAHMAFNGNAHVEAANKAAERKSKQAIKKAEEDLEIQLGQLKQLTESTQRTADTEATSLCDAMQQPVSEDPILARQAEDIIAYHCVQVLGRKFGSAIIGKLLVSSMVYLRNTDPENDTLAMAKIVIGNLEKPQEDQDQRPAA
jgi:hypothetical protein